MTNFEGSRIAKFLCFVQFLVLLVNTILKRINHLSKSFNEKVDNLQKISSQQLVAANQLKAENELLKLKQSKMKLAIDNLLVRTQMELKQIEDLKDKVEEMEDIDSENQAEIKNLLKNIAQKKREIFKKQLQIDFIKLQLQ